MNLEALRIFCLSLPGTTEDVKWGNDLCFLAGKKMYCVTDLKDTFNVSFKVSPEEYVSLVNTPNILPAPYLARYNWILVTDPGTFSKQEWEHYIRRSFETISKKR